MIREYKLDIAVFVLKGKSFLSGDCIWSKWYDTECSVTCGIGTKIRKRYSRVPPHLVEGGNCDNVTQKLESCDTKIPCKHLGNFHVFIFFTIHTIILYHKTANTFFVFNTIILTLQDVKMVISNSQESTSHKFIGTANGSTFVLFSLRKTTTGPSYSATN